MLGPMTSRTQCPVCGGMMAVHARVCRVCTAGPAPSVDESWTWPVVLLRDAMRDAGMTVEELARLSGVAYRSIMYARAGCALSRPNALAVAQVLRISPVSLLAVRTDRGTYHRRRAPEDPRQMALGLDGGE